MAARALSTADTLQQLAETQGKGSTRVPATLSEAPGALAQADRPTMTPLSAGYRAHRWPSPSGGVAQRCLLLSAEHRHAQAQRTVDKQLRTHGQRDGAACQPRSRLTLAGEAAAPQALATLTPG